jgi:hypothetical protein
MPSPEWRNALFVADMDIQRCLVELQDAVQQPESVGMDWF